MSNQQQTFETVVQHELTTLTITEPAEVSGYNLLAGDYKAIHDAQLKQLEAEVASLPAITDKKTYEENQRKRTELVNRRTTLDARRKALFEPMRRLKEQVDAYIGTTKDSGLQARLAAMEETIRNKQQVWDAEQERKRQEALAIIEERNAARCKSLLDLGFTFDGTAYWIVMKTPSSYADTRVGYAHLCAMPDEAWDAWFASVLPIAEAVAQQKEEERQAEAARKAEEERQRKEAEAKAAEERAELEKLREEKRQRDAEALRQRNDRQAFRLSRLQELAGNFAEAIRSQGWVSLAELGDAEWEQLQEQVSNAAVRMAESESVHEPDPVLEVVQDVAYVEEVATELPDPTPQQEQRSVDRGLLEMALAAALSLLDEATAARSAVTSTIAQQTLDRVIASARASVDNLRGTIKKDL